MGTPPAAPLAAGGCRVPHVRPGLWRGPGQGPGRELRGEGGDPLQEERVS